MRRGKLLMLEAVMVLAAINLWTGSPLLALWVGSQVVEAKTQVTMGAVALIVATMIAISAALMWTLNAAAAAHRRLTGRSSAVNRHVPWLRSMSDERVEWDREKATLTAIDYVLVGSVVMAVLLFEAWFFLTDPSPLPPGPAKD